MRDAVCQETISVRIWIFPFHQVCITTGGRALHERGKADAKGPRAKRLTLIMTGRGAEIWKFERRNDTYFSGLGMAVPTVFWGALPALLSA